MNSIPTSLSPSNSHRSGSLNNSRCSTPPPSSRPLSDNSDRNNNATPPRGGGGGTPNTPLAPSARRPSIARSPPPGARPKDLPPGAAPIGSIPTRPPPGLPVPSSNSSGISVPLLASQLGRPVNLGDRVSTHHSGSGSGFLGPALPPLSPHHLNLLSHTLSPIAVIPTGNGKFMARNYNGTLAVTSHPSNESELQIYRVLQRANLLAYYDTFIAQGGDDVQQLCEAGEAEFLEIMDLVGMASKPMHVRRLQKALQEWVQNPGLFQAPLVPLSNLSAPSAAAAVIRASSSSSSGASGAGLSALSAANPSSQIPPSHPSMAGNSRPSNDPLSLISSTGPLMSARRSVSPPTSISGGPGSIPTILESSASGPNKTSSAPHSPSPVGSLISKENHQSGGATGVPSPTYSQSGQEYPPLSSSPLQLTPSLVESQIQRIADTAENLIKAMSDNVDANKLKNNKKISKEVEMVLAMPDEEPRKMEEIRRFSAIYGRFDCKRKPEKPLTLHEVSVNEAAAQLCLRKPILLMRRDELFPLARQVVRDSGYSYSKGHSRSQFQRGYPSKIFGLDKNAPPGSGAKSGDDENSRDSSNGGSERKNMEGGPHPKKRSRYSEGELEAGDHLSKKERDERLHEELRRIDQRMDELRNAAAQAREANDLGSLQAFGQQLEILQSTKSRIMIEQHHDRPLRPRTRGRVSTSSDPERPDTDEDSQMSYSNTSSPNQVSSQHGSYVLSASGGQVIAIQNPALQMSSHGGALQTSIRAASTSPNRNHHEDSKNLVTLLNLSRRGVGPPTSHLAASGSNGKDHINAKKPSATTIIHSDDEEMTFKQEPASPPPPASSTASNLDLSGSMNHRTNGKN